MLNQVERRRFLVEPPRKDPLNLSLRILHVELHERSGQLLDFVRSGGLARAQPDGHVAGADRLPRLERELSGNAVALVEEPYHRGALRHRSRAGGERGHRLWNVHRLRLGLGVGLAGLSALRHVAAIAGRQRGQACQQGDRKQTCHCAAGSSIVPSPGLPALPVAGAAGCPLPDRLISEPTRPIMSTDP